MPSAHFVQPLLGLSFILAATSLIACGGNDEVGPPPDFEFPIEVQAEDRNANPIPGVPVTLDDNVVGFTGADGKFSGFLVDKPGHEVQLGVGEVSGYRLTTSSPIVETLGVTTSLQGELRGIPVSYSATFQSVKNEYLVWIELSCGEHLDDKYCADIPVQIDGVEHSRTDHKGVAQFAFEGIPGESAEVTLRTPSFNENDEDSIMMEPRRPSFVLDLTHDATIFRIDQEFTDPAARRAAERRPTRSVRNRNTVRNTTPTPTPAPAPKPQEEESSRGPIQLF